jgi:hypothetical protein
VDFTNILLQAFICADSIIVKKTDRLTVLFALLGFAHVKAVHKMLVKLTTPDDDLKVKLLLFVLSLKAD